MESNSSHKVQYVSNMYTYLVDVLKSGSVIESNVDRKDNIEGFEQFNKKDIEKTLQFLPYIYIKFKNKEDDLITYGIFVNENENKYVSRSANFKQLLNFIKGTKIRLVIISNIMMKESFTQIIMNEKKIVEFKNFLYNKFIVDPRKHILVPKHKLLSEEEVRKLMHTNKISSKSSLKGIREDDAQIIWLGGNVGDIVQIDERTLHGIKPDWRVVVKATS